MSIALALVSSRQEVFSLTTSSCGFNLTTRSCGAGCERSTSENEVGEVHPRSCCGADSDVAAEVRMVSTSPVCVLVRVIAPTSPRESPATLSPQLMRLPRCSRLRRSCCAERETKWVHACALCSGECSLRDGRRGGGSRCAEVQPSVCVRELITCVEAPRGSTASFGYRKFWESKRVSSVYRSIGTPSTC